MNAEVFLDTNIAIYAYSAQETDKFEAANHAPAFHRHSLAPEYPPS